MTRDEAAGYLISEARRSAAAMRRTHQDSTPEHMAVCGGLCRLVVCADALEGAVDTLETVDAPARQAARKVGF